MGTEEQKQKYISILTGSELKIGAMGLTEPNSGSDSLALETTATKVDGGYVLNGTKQFCTNGGIADIRLPSPPPTNRSAPSAWPPCHREGHRGHAWRQGTQARRARVTHPAQVIFEDCFIPDNQRLGYNESGKIGPGRSAPWSCSRRRRDRGRGGRSASAGRVRVCPRLLAARFAFGKPISKHEAIAFKLADMATEIDARLLTWRAGWMVMNGIPLSRGEGSMAKLFAGDIAMKVTVDAVQILGGYGYIKDYPVERFMRNANSTRSGREPRRSSAW